MISRFARRGPAAALAALALLLAGCAQDYPQNTLAPVGEVAVQQAGLFKIVLWIAVAIFVFVEGLIVIAILRFRASKRPGVPAQVHGNTRLELLWTVIPSILLVGIAWPTVGGIWDLARDPGPSALHVTVVGHQWWWEYRYPADEVVTANELVVPTGRDVRLTLESVDVIHSFWMPRLAGKQDVIPGRQNPLNFSVDTPGTYFGQCAEFCGASHANMKLRVVAVGPDEFDAWVRAQKTKAATPGTGDAAAGLRLFQEKGCMGCHAISGVENAVGIAGPDLTHLQSRRSFAGSMFELTDENLRRWLADPPGMKPGAKMPNLGLSPAEIDKLVAYLGTLR